MIKPIPGLPNPAINEILALAASVEEGTEHLDEYAAALESRSAELDVEERYSGQPRKPNGQFGKDDDTHHFYGAWNKGKGDGGKEALKGKEHGKAAEKQQEAKDETKPEPITQEEVTGRTVPITRVSEHDFGKGANAAEVSKQLATLPKGHIDGLQNIEFHKGSIESNANEVTRKTGASGYYQQGELGIMLAVFGKEGVQEGTLYHEAGHHVHQAKLTEQAANEWRDISQGGRTCTVSNYGKISDGEHFAEFYSTFSRVRETPYPMLKELVSAGLRANEPRAYDFMTRLFSDSKMLVEQGKIWDPIVGDERWGTERKVKQ